MCITELLDVKSICLDATPASKKEALDQAIDLMVKNESKIQVKDEKVALRIEQNREEKQKIAQYAASLIEADDFVYLDAGTTTGAMIPYIEETNATFVTNAVSHALMLAEKGLHVILIGGEMKAATEAIVGNEAYQNIQKYNFTKG